MRLTLLMLKPLSIKWSRKAAASADEIANAQVKADGEITKEIAELALKLLDLSLIHI